MSLQVAVKKLEHALDLPLPSYATTQSAGMDLLAAVKENIIIPAGERILVPTGIGIALPIGFEAQVRPRSGLALKNGVTVLNSPGTVDADYRGEIRVILINTSREDFVISRGMRIAQLIVAPYAAVEWNAVDILEESFRGEGGFGSTGTDAVKNTQEEVTEPA